MATLCTQYTYVVDLEALSQSKSLSQSAFHMPRLSTVTSHCYEDQSNLRVKTHDFATACLGCARENRKAMQMWFYKRDARTEVSLICKRNNINQVFCNMRENLLVVSNIASYGNFRYFFERPQSYRFFFSTRC